MKLDKKHVAIFSNSPSEIPAIFKQYFSCFPVQKEREIQNENTKFFIKYEIT